MQFSVLHYHFRPGGVRRVIEQGLPALVRAVGGVTRVTLASGEAPEAAWRQLMEEQLFPTEVVWLTEPALGYWSEQQSTAEDVRHSIRGVLPRLLSPGSILWAHNLCVGRNMILAGEMAAAATNTDTSLWLHHHDWWWDGRWERWPEMHAQGFDSLEEAVTATIPSGERATHFCINASDARRLTKWTGLAAGFLPNPLAMDDVAREEKERARDFLRGITGTAAAWVYPCRALRRKNIAEALLVQRWLAPEAATVTTGAPASAAEEPAFRSLRAAAEQNAWPLHLAVCTRPDAPAVPSLVAAADAVAVTSLREGFGLVYHEAAAASRPLLARIPGGLEDTLSAIGFRFRSGWREILIPDHLYDTGAEAVRVAAGRDRLRTLLPSSLHAALEMPASVPGNVDFGHLSLRAQIEVLSHAPAMSGKECLPLNPALSLSGEPQPAATERWTPVRWAETMLQHARASAPSSRLLPDWAQQAEAIITPLVLEWLQFPLLWERESSALPQP